MQAQHLPRVTVIGAGPAGLAAARHLAASGGVRVTLVQREGNALYLPGILPTITGMRPVSVYRQPIHLQGVTVRSGEALRVDSGHILLHDGCMLGSDAIIAAPGLRTDASALPRGPRTFPVWELESAHVALPAIERWTGGRLVVSIASLPYRCPPAPYGLAMTLRRLGRDHGIGGEVVLTTPEPEPLS